MALISDEMKICILQRSTTQLWHPTTSSNTAVIPSHFWLSRWCHNLRINTCKPLLVGLWAFPWGRWLSGRRCWGGELSRLASWWRRTYQHQTNSVFLITSWLWLLVSEASWRRWLTLLLPRWCSCVLFVTLTRVWAGNSLDPCTLFISSLLFLMRGLSKTVRRPCPCNWACSLPTSLSMSVTRTPRHYHVRWKGSGPCPCHLAQWNYPYLDRDQPSVMPRCDLHQRLCDGLENFKSEAIMMASVLISEGIWQLSVKLLAAAGRFETGVPTLLFLWRREETTKFLCLHLRGICQDLRISLRDHEGTRRMLN